MPSFDISADVNAATEAIPDLPCQGNGSSAVPLQCLKCLQCQK